MALGKMILTWIHHEERTVGYVAKQSDIAAHRLIDLIAGDAAPDADEIDALARATGLPVQEALARDSRCIA